MRDITFPILAGCEEIDSKVVQPTSLVDRSSPDGVVLMKGVFDLFHTGHLYALLSGRRLGSCLVVGVASDESVAARKGPTRPVVPWEGRAAVVAGLACVDVVTAYDDYSPFELITAVQPAVFAASHFRYLSEVEKAQLSDAGIELTLVERPPLPATSDLIRRIRSRGSGLR